MANKRTYYKSYYAVVASGNPYRIYNDNDVEVGSIRVNKNWRLHPGIQKYQAYGAEDMPMYRNRIAEAGSIEAVLERFIDNPIMSYQTR